MPPNMKNETISKSRKPAITALAVPRCCSQICAGCAGCFQQQPEIGQHTQRLRLESQARLLCRLNEHRDHKSHKRLHTQENLLQKLIADTNLAMPSY